MPHKHGGSQKPIETIRLSLRDKKRIIEAINKQGEKNQYDSEKRATRVDYNIGELIVNIIHPSGTEMTCSVLPRNLAAKGVAFLHGRYVHTDCLCIVHLESLDGSVVDIPGKISRCNHLNGVLHEVAVIFDHGIELTEFVKLKPEEALEYHREQKQSEYEFGRALIVDDLSANRRLFGMWLKKLGMEASEATNTQEAINALKENPDITLILLDLNLGPENGFDVAKAVRKTDPSTVIIVVSANDDQDSKDKANELGCNGYLVKPFDALQLRELIVDAMLTGGTTPPKGGVIRSSKADEPDMLPLIEEFIGQLGTMVNDLEKLREEMDVKAIYQICHQLKGAGGGYGFEPITRAAQEALEALHAEPPVPMSILRAVDSLIALSRKATV